jgi:hypothetical protein
MDKESIGKFSITNSCFFSYAHTLLKIFIRLINIFLNFHPILLLILSGQVLRKQPFVKKASHWSRVPSRFSIGQNRGSLLWKLLPQPQQCNGRSSEKVSSIKGFFL